MFWLEWEVCSLDCFVELIPFYYVWVPSRKEVNGGKGRKLKVSQVKKATETHLSAKIGFARKYFGKDKRKSGEP
ncbi:hypothetical protein AS888_19355 [Peribacillus simplex]|uniref:Uncharacterized protein n=1 Tax=Peribacillus simplex TaxID=1478 RepID=A0A125QS14_9BACI|nr:hypothetical protein AS888_19355 [Peribacillus simplex]